MKVFAPFFLARLAKDRPEKRTEDEEFFKSLRVKVFSGLQRRFSLINTDESLYEEEAIACWPNDEENIVLLNAIKPERELWSGIAESLSSRVGQNYYEAFETLLLCSTDQERIDKLRKSGVSEEDILYCKQVLEEISKTTPPEEKVIKEEVPFKGIDHTTEEKEEVEWKEECLPEEASIEVEQFEPPKEVKIVSKRDEIIPKDTEEEEDMEGLPALTPKDKKRSEDGGNNMFFNV